MTTTTVTPHPLGPFVTRLAQSRVYDGLMRLPLAGWAIFLAILSMAEFAGYTHGAGATASMTLHTVNLAMRLSTIGFLILMAASVLLRGRPRGKAEGLAPRISALIGTMLLTSLAFFPRQEVSIAAGVVSTMLILIGNTCAIIILARLGRSFSVMAEARRLVTTGPYRFVRHPLYLAEALAGIGLVIQFWSPGALLLLVVQLAFQLRRMANEEIVLSGLFPEYAAYRQKTARVLPGIY